MTPQEQKLFDEFDEKFSNLCRAELDADNGRLIPTIPTDPREELKNWISTHYIAKERVKQLLEGEKESRFGENTLRDERHEWSDRERIIVVEGLKGSLFNEE